MSGDLYSRLSNADAPLDAEGKVPAGGGYLAPTFTIRTAFAAAAQDATVFGAGGCPVKCRIIDVNVNVDTNNASETLTLRDASGGGGNAYSAALSLGSAGRVREATAPANRVLAKGAQLYMRRNTTVGVGDVVIELQPEQ